MNHCWCLFLCMVVRMILREMERSKIGAVEMDNFRDLLGIRRMDKVPNAQTDKAVVQGDEGYR